MGLFSNIKQAQDVKEAEDRVGGGFTPLESNVYKAIIKQAYAKPSQSGALGVHIEFEIHPKDGKARKHTESFYVTNKNGENFYTDKNGDKHPLAGYNHVNDIALGLTGQTLAELEANGKIEPKNVKVYNFTTKKEEIEQLPILIPFLDKEIAVAIVKRRENKTKKVGDTYEPTNEERVYNAVEKVFAIKDGNPFTTKEIKAGLTEPKFVMEWLDYWKDRTDDRYKEVAGASGSSSSSTVTSLDIG